MIGSEHGVMVWSEKSISECPGCGATVAVGIMSLAATCKIDGYYYVDINDGRGWYSSREAYERGDRPVRAWEPHPKRWPDCTLKHEGPCNPCCNPWDY